MELLTPASGIILWAIITSAIIILPIFVLIDILRNSFESNAKLLWIIVVVTLPIVGSGLYLIIGRKLKIKRHEN